MNNSNEENLESLLICVKDVQKILGIGITNTYKIIRQENIPHIKIGRQIKVFLGKDFTSGLRIIFPITR